MTGRRGRSAAGWLLVTLALPACRRALATVVDLPAPAPRPATVADAARSAPAARSAADSARPPIERLLHPDSARALLPRDHAGNIDWMAALERGTIRPRPTLPGDPAPSDPVPFKFGFDFYFPGPDTTFDAFFPHSKHTEWLNCQQCHARLFPYRNPKIQMADIFQGKYCAECHGRVSFPVLTGCERCHVRTVMPPDRAQAELLGTLQLTRVASVPGEKPRATVQELPPATFPHWVHRIRYRCKACHMGLFEPKNGANLITMKDISDGKACGRCHDGVSAFKAGFGSCERCHIPAPPAPHAPAPAPGG